MVACSSSTSSDTPTDAGTIEDAGVVDTGPVGPPCGRNATVCETGGTCEGAADCKSGLCRDTKCQDISPADGVKDGDETDIDCGGSAAPACVDGKGCAVKDDCVSTVCTGGKCQAPSPTDGIKNGDETGVDCGGSKAPKCPTGQGCKVTADCNNVACDPATKLCAAPAHDDGLKNGDETGIDCGGPTAVTKCPTGQGCAAQADCDNVLCTALVCAAPAKDDKLKNGTETDVDCGGGAPTNADRCPLTKTCAVDGDCTSVACNYNKQCIDAPSCKTQYGGDTCGKGEVGVAGHVHESCCKSVPLNDNSARIDKYEITAGRMRQFIASVGNDVQGWVSTHRAITSAQIPDDMVPYLPTGLKTPVKTIRQCLPDGSNCADVPLPLGVYAYLGNAAILRDRPCPNCGQGCYVGTLANRAYGHPTYWWPDTVQTVEFNQVARAFTQQQLDVKSLNCTPQLLFAAFCAWDGGRLPTTAELGGNSPNSAWGNNNYPWGNQSPYDTTTTADPHRITYAYPTQETSPWYFVPSVIPGNSGFSNVAEATTYNWTNHNPFRSDNGQGMPMPYIRYVYPFITSSNWDQTDQAFAIAAPGRFVNDYHANAAGTDGWNDIGSNLMESTATQSGNDDTDHNGWRRYQWVGGSWEGHGIQRGGYDGNGNTLTKYGKMGARCARPL